MKRYLRHVILLKTCSEDVVVAITLSADCKIFICPLFHCKKCLVKPKSCVVLHKSFDIGVEDTDEFNRMPFKIRSSRDDTKSSRDHMDVSTETTNRRCWVSGPIPNSPKSRDYEFVSGQSSELSNKSMDVSMSSEGSSNVDSLLPQAKGRIGIASDCTKIPQKSILISFHFERLLFASYAQYD